MCNVGIFVIVSNFLCLCWQLAAEASLFSRTLHVHRCVREHVLNIYEHGVLQTACWNFAIFTAEVAVRHKDELIKFLRSKAVVVVAVFIQSCGQ